MSGQVRRDPRLSAIVLQARYRCLGDEEWLRAELRDLSVGGALVSCKDQLGVGQRLQLMMQRPIDKSEIELVAEVLRLVDRAEGPAAGVRFMQLTKEAAGYIAEVLNDALGSADEPTAVSLPPGLGPQELSTLRLHDTSIYELLGLDPACSDGELESRCEALIVSVAQVHQEAAGARKDRLRVLHMSLERLRPLWSDPIKRARYDFRWGYVRAEERILAAARGLGLHTAILAGVWIELFPERVREAEEVIADAAPEELFETLQKAVELEPFARRWRQRLAQMQAPPLVIDVDGTGDTAALTDRPSERGSLSDLSLKELVKSLAENEDEAEIEVRAQGKSLGVLGVSNGDIVIAISGEERGVAAVKRLLRMRDGSFQVRYTPPRDALRHMRMPALEVLKKAA